MTDPLAALVKAIRESQRVVVLTGAGISAESGLATFRDPQEGLWAKYQPQDLASPDAFAQNPELVWQWYQWRRQRIREVEPNAGHDALVEIARTHGGLTLVTQNVDGLHQRAGHPDVIEFHGNIHRNLCHREGKAVAVDDSGETPPPCPDCGAPVRPGVVWFGESIPATALERATTAAHNADFFLAVGTSATVYPAAGLADLARAQGASVGEINPDATPMSSNSDLTLRAAAGEALPEVASRLKG